ncbi:MAG: tyrosine-type recombinase/integrase [Lachnospiraceae bacterium]|nr:tyrosine-type recombinase/integrase [Lachnospiraceae bacterium]
MSKILDNIHMHKISRTKDGRWVTYVADPTKPNGLRQVRRNSKSELYAYLIEFYGVLPEKEATKTIGEVFHEWVEYKREFTRSNYKPLSPSTIRRYELDYKKYLENTLLSKSPIDLDDMTVEQYLIKIVSSSKMKPQAFGNIYGYLCQMYRYAVRKKYILTDPMTFIDKCRIMSFCCAVPPKKDSERIISLDDLHKFLGSVHAHLNSYPGYMPDYAILLGSLTGMRVGEIVALKWECVDDDFIHVDYSEHRHDYGDHRELVIGEPKSHKHRLIPVTKDISELLDTIRDHSIDDTWVFADTEGRINATTVSNACRRRSEEAGIKRTSIHEIRRTVSSYLNTVLPREAVANMLGHLPTTNERFYDYDISSRMIKVEALEKLSDNVIKFSDYGKTDKSRKAQ